MTERLPPDTIAQFAPGRAALVAGVATTADVPGADPGAWRHGPPPARPPMALSLVVDCSSPTQGHPLLEARGGAAQVVARVRPTTPCRSCAPTTMPPACPQLPRALEIG